MRTANWVRICLPRSWRGWAVIALVAVLAGAVVADRVLAGVLENRAAARIRCLAGVDENPEVHVRGFPFLTQSLRGRFDEVRVDVRDVRRGAITATAVEVTLYQLSVPDELISGRPGPHRVEVGVVAAEAIVGYAGLGSLGDREARFGARDGLITITTTARLAGRQVPVTILAAPMLSGRTVRIEPREVEVLGIRQPADRVLDRLGSVAPIVERDLPALPGGLAYAGVDATGEGLRVRVSGRDVGATIGGGAGQSNGGRSCGGAA